MFGRDYIMKQIDQLGTVLNRIVIALVQRKKGAPEELSFDQINALLTDHLDLDIPKLLLLDNNELTDVLKTEYNLTNELIGQLGDILYEIAELDQNVYSTEALYQKALTIFQYLEKHDNVFSFDRHQKIKKMIPSPTDSESSSE